MFVVVKGCVLSVFGVSESKIIEFVTIYYIRTGSKSNP